MSFKESSLPDKGEELIQLNKAILIGAYFNTAEKGLCAEYLNELDLLCQTLGLNSIKGDRYD